MPAVSNLDLPLRDQLRPPASSTHGTVEHCWPLLILRLLDVICRCLSAA
jgi:hypothetical protein